MSVPSKKKEIIDTILKEEIVNTVLALIRDDEPITMDEVAKRSGVAKGTLYNYFGNRETLMNHVHMAVLSPIHNANKEIFNGDMPPQKKIIEFIKTVYSLHKCVGVYFRFLQNKRTVAEEIKEKYSLAIEPLASICRDGINEGIFIKVDPFVMAEMIFGTVVGTLKSIQYRETDLTNIEHIKDDVIKIVKRIIIKEVE